MDARDRRTVNASADVGRLVVLANRVLDRVETRTILRVANG